MNKKKIFKIIFWLSFLPYIILFLLSTYHAFYGYDVYTWIKPEYVRTIYGIDAFAETLVWNMIKFSVIPILPIVLIFQIIYIVLCLKNKNVKLSEE